MRNFLLGFATCYLAVGLIMGSSLAAAMPAINALGVGYYTLTWPMFLASGSHLITLEPYVPSWCFTLKN